LQFVSTAISRFPPFLTWHFPPNRRRANPGIQKLRGDVFRVLHIDAENDRASMIRQAHIGSRQQTVPERRIDDTRKLTLHKVSVTNLYAVQRESRIDSPAAHRTKIAFRDHLAKIASVANLLKHFAQALLVSAPGCGCEADEVARSFGPEQSKMIEDPAIAFRNGVVRFVHHDD
jgi:hypothetical protein